MIVYYHLLMICVVPFNDNPIFKALELPGHIGVVLFVLISGYFGIHPTSKGFLKLLFIFFVYSLPEIYFKVKDSASIVDLGKSLFFFSHTHFWFIRTYVFLYLVSPMVNMFIEKSTVKQRVYMMCSLFFISIYIGTVGGDPSLGDGKNLVNFIFVYMLGNVLRQDASFLKKIRSWALLAVYVAMNLALVFGYTAMSDNIVGKVLWRLSFPYSSPVLLVNSVLFFVLFTRLSFQSKAVNWLARSSLAIYLIHSNRPLFFDWDGMAGGELPGGIIGNMAKWAGAVATNDLLYGMLLLLVALLVIVICVGIDQFLSPVWKFAGARFDRLYHRLGF